MSLIRVFGGKAPLYDSKPLGIPSSGIIFTNLDQYIINGVRQADTGVTIRSNITTVNRIFIVTKTSTFKFMTFLRIPPTNWTSTLLTLRPTLSLASGSSGTIDGETSSKQFWGLEESILNPPTGRVNESNLEHYDTYKMKPVNESTTTLTPGEYQINLICAEGGNRTMATMLMSTFPIDTNKDIYFSLTQPFGVTSYFVMQLEI